MTEHNPRAPQTVDFGRTAGDYARHRAGFPPMLFDRLVALGLLRPGADVLDLGTGTGTVARQCAQRGATVTGLDPSPALLAQAQALDAAAGVAVTYVEAKAEATGLPDAAFDLVVAGQCWHWFDRPAAAAEAWRLLRHGGALALVHFDWLPLPGNVVAATEALIVKYNPAWKMGGGTGIYPRWYTDLRSAGYADVSGFSFDVPAPYSHEAWRGRIRASAGVAASLSPAEVETFDAELAAILAADFPDDPLAVPHCVSAVYGWKR
jgi:SAM-dependent methyltransferase